MTSILHNGMIKQAAAIKAAASSIQPALDILEQVKQGKIDIRDRSRFAEVQGAVATLEQAVRVALNYPPDANFKDDFISTEYGDLLGYGYRWLYADELITWAEAAAMITGNTVEEYRDSTMMRSKMHRLIHPDGIMSTPRLKLFWLPDERYPKRVRLPEVEQEVNRKRRRRRL